MIGAILGDIIGSPYEFDCNNIKTKDFPLFSRHSTFTDDSVMTCAISQALLDVGPHAPDEEVRRAAVEWMRQLGRDFPHAGYGGMFIRWLLVQDAGPYNSFGNGAAMRISAAGWLADRVEEGLRLARLCTEVTHNHPGGIKGAQAVAAAIWMGQNGSTKAEVKAFVEERFGYDLSATCDEIRPGYHHVESCQETVPQAFAAFMEGESFEDVIRNAVSLGGDSDTLAAIAGSMAEAFYPIPEALYTEARLRLDQPLLDILDRFRTKAAPV